MARNIPVTAGTINVAAYFDISSTQVQNDELCFVASGGGTVVLDLPAISTLPGGAMNQKIGYVLADNSTAVTLTPVGTDTISTNGTGVSVAVTAGLGKGGRLQPLSNYIWDEQLSK